MNDHDTDDDTRAHFDQGDASDRAYELMPEVEPEPFIPPINPLDVTHPTDATIAYRNLQTLCNTPEPIRIAYTKASANALVEWISAIREELRLTRRILGTNGGISINGTELEQLKRTRLRVDVWGIP